jgi:hypothetical protein
MDAARDRPEKQVDFVLGVGEGRLDDARGVTVG